MFLDIVWDSSNVMCNYLITQNDIHILKSVDTVTKQH